VVLTAALHSFLRVAETGSVSAVAVERGVTQPAVFRQVSALEQRFGTRLVHCSTVCRHRPEAGRGLLPAALRALVSQAGEV
jgi:DNA-binding transcriptional LysR family regulator